MDQAVACRPAAVGLALLVLGLTATAQALVSSPP